MSFRSLKSRRMRSDHSGSELRCAAIRLETSPTLHGSNYINEINDLPSTLGILSRSTWHRMGQAGDFRGRCTSLIPYKGNELAGMADRGSGRTNARCETYKPVS